jgi:hypothetical protein
MAKGFSTRDVLTPAGVKLLATVVALKSKPYVKVGVLQESFDKDKKVRDKAPSLVTLGDVAVWNEYGTDRIPERSFIRSTHDENVSKWRKVTDDLRSAVIIGKHTTEWALKYMGLVIKTAIQKKIRDQIPPPNAESTVARKHSTTPLIDTGQLINSLNYEVHRKGDDGRTD